jgi:crotonobetainyl-CoA:carnitine CoA-transferase CaiB-like acyl-CoA transferase
MAEKDKAEGMLSPYRVLDLTDEKGWMCGKLLGDLGAEVIKIEPPGGDPGRRIGPFYHDDPDPEKSLYWFAFNTSKWGITLDIETADGREVFKRLVKSADFVIESFSPGHLDQLGLGYSALEKLNPRLIMVSITPFGQTGPYKDYKGPDIVAWAMGGQMYLSGDADRPPVRVSYHSQAYLNAASEAAAGAMGALYYREMTGEGLQVDISIQEVVTRVSHQATTIPWDTNKVVGRRGVRAGANANARITSMWPCKDGYVIWLWWGGFMAARQNVPLLQWMDEEGMLDDFLRGFNWDTYYTPTVSQETVDKIEEPTRRFFLLHTKAELFEGALKRKAMLYPVSTTADLIESPQLAARGYWVEVEHPELGTTITYPGAFVSASEAPPRIMRRAPLIGEHNQEIYEQELGLSKEQLLALKQAGVV